jgi:hypothetical protein
MVEAAEFCSKCGARQASAPHPPAKADGSVWPAPPSADRGRVVVERRGNGFGLPPMDPVRWVLLLIILAFGACSVGVCVNSL